jgi:hypothetical protein
VVKVTSELAGFSHDSLVVAALKAAELALKAGSSTMENPNPFSTTSSCRKASAEATIER